ncbi:MAG: UDP-galactopyranose mutase [Clostridia bacterium]|nr:UDP-galactopyranose mutase [Clostridia bacterium]
MQYDWIIVGAGMTGAVAARTLAEAGKNVLVLEKREHIAGNAYDELDEAGVLIHRYGPHIFHTNDEEVWQFLSRFTEWRTYRHKVLAEIDGEYMPVPFNLNSMVIAFGFRKAEQMKKALLEKYGEGSNVSILELRSAEEPLLRELAEFVYENVFKYYTVKQWGVKPEDIDPSVTARVPVRISKENGYFTDKYQGMPLRGYTPMFASMLEHPAITLRLNADARELLILEEGKILFEGAPFDGKVLYTGPLDELFGFAYGRLTYRSLDFVFETLKKEYAQLCGTVNYTVSENYTRITEFKHLTGQKCPVTTVMKEYSKPCGETDIPYYPVSNEETRALYARYRAEADKYPALVLGGRLGEFRYYNMDAAAASALRLCRDHL